VTPVAPSWRVGIPLPTINPLNRREHHHARARRVVKERGLTTLCLRSQMGTPPALPVTITLVRVSPREMDSDGAVAALKSVRDAVASWLGVDDRDTADLVWRYEQRKGKVGVEIQVEARSC